jgi:hypothetical protein
VVTVRRNVARNSKALLTEVHKIVIKSATEDSDFDLQALQL